MGEASRKDWKVSGPGLGITRGGWWYVSGLLGAVDCSWYCVNADVSVWVPVGLVNLCPFPSPLLRNCGLPLGGDCVAVGVPGEVYVCDWLGLFLSIRLGRVESLEAKREVADLGDRVPLMVGLVGLAVGVNSELD